MSTISLSHISKEYKKGTRTVEDFSLEIGEHEFVVLVGPSGCGKSTLLRMIAGLEEITEGELWIDDRLMNSLPSGDRKLAMVFQNYALYPNMTVRKNISFGLESERDANGKKLPRTQIRQRVDRAADMLGLSELMDRRPSQLSGGQKQRVAIGSAIVRDAKAYLMDEPLSNLDAKLRMQMRVELQKLYRTLSASVIYVTHDQVEAMTLATKIVVMNQGMLQQAGSPEEIYERPRNLFVAGFIGSPRMNLLKVHTVLEGGRICLHGAGFAIPLADHASKAMLRNGYLDEDLVMGVRPEDLSLSGRPEEALPFSFELSENLGDHRLLYGVHGKTADTLIARSPEGESGPNLRSYPLYVQADRIHLFEESTGMAVLHGTDVCREETA